MKYYIYTRKSTEDEERQVMSIEAQLTELHEYAKRENLEIAEEFIESKSAKNPGREIFNEMIEKIKESKEPIGILAWHPDRLARNSVDGGQIIYLIDTGKIVSLRFPTFWFEPTPQGLFMLQVAFGQSKYYSDNLSENVKRGFRQKLRRGEWPAKAPLGYINNPKTRNIEPDLVKAKIIQKVFEEYSQGKHTLESLGKRLAEFGLVSKSGTPLAKATTQRMLTNLAYIGLIQQKGETYEGKYQPIISRELFEKVKQILKERAKPRHSKKRHNFPFVGLFRCGECGGMITAQFSHGNGGIYRYYRCTKKFGVCSQRYLREDLLVEQLKNYLGKLVLPKNWIDKMLAEVEKWRSEEEKSSQNFLQNLEKDIEETKQKLDKLVSGYLDGIIEKEIYLQKKEDLIKTKIALEAKKEDFRKGKRNWLEPLKNWILEVKRIQNLVSAGDFQQIAEFTKKSGTNRVLHDRKISLTFLEPWLFISPSEARRVDLPASPLARQAQTPLSFTWSGQRELNPAIARTPSVHVNRYTMPRLFSFPHCLDAFGASQDSFSSKFFIFFFFYSNRNPDPLQIGFYPSFSYGIIFPSQFDQSPDKD